MTRFPTAYGHWDRTEQRWSRIGGDYSRTGHSRAVSTFSGDPFRSRPVRQHLYFLLNHVTGLVKIGVAKNPEWRHRDLQQAAGVPLTLLGVLENKSEWEMPLHLLFAKDRRIGEWFVASDELLELATDPSRILSFLQGHERDIAEAEQRLAEARRKAGIRWRAVVLRNDETAPA